MNKDHSSHRTIACEGHHGGCEASGSRWTVVDMVVKRGSFSSVWVWICTMVLISSIVKLGLNSNCAYV